MQQSFNPNSYPCYPVTNPNAVNINIISPQAYGTAPAAAPSSAQLPYYSMYGQNMMPNLPLYPQNYNNMLNQPGANNLNAANNTALYDKTPNNEAEKTEKTEEKKDDKKEAKTIVPLTDDYIKSLENYMNNDNPKVRLIGAKDLMERFKEDENRKDNPSLIPLLNKALRDTSPAVRFLALTTLQTGYCVGNDETVQILKEIQSQNKDKIGEDALLASEILLKLSAPQPVKQ